MIEQKQTLTEYLLSFTPGSRPHRATVIRRIMRGDLPGIKEGGTWYIIRQISTGDDRADEILRRHASA